jgi:hypothetical protein
MAMTTHAVGATYTRVASAAAVNVALQATGTAGLRVTPGEDEVTPDDDAPSLLLKYGQMTGRSEFLTGAIYARSALQGRASEATVEIS